MIIIIFFRGPFLDAAVCLALLEVLPVASQPGGDGSPQAWAWGQPDLASVGQSLHGHLAVPYLTLYLPYSQLCFSFPWHFILFLEGLWLAAALQMEGTLYAWAYPYWLLFLFYPFRAHTQVESITPILNPVWLRHLVLERISQNGEFTVIHSQVSSLRMKYMCLLSYFKAFSFSFASLVLIMLFSACYTFLFFPSSLSCSLISAKIFNHFSCFLLFACKSNHRSASNSYISSSNCFYL